jgi:1-acyl-sn-glycerol-3-phosphate acyltransferase
MHVSPQVVVPFMSVLAVLCDLLGNGKVRMFNLDLDLDRSWKHNSFANIFSALIQQRRLLDWIIHIWAKLSLELSLCRPKVYGLENLPAPGETVVYVPNHTSFVDILLFSGFVPRPFKYLSKDEIKNIPIIGWAMHLAKHVFLKRDDLKSTLEVTEQCIQRVMNFTPCVRT